jgi:hypothetical protein
MAPKYQMFEQQALDLARERPRLFELFTAAGGRLPMVPAAGAYDIALDPPVSEAQRRAMYAAAEGRSTLGIPQSVGKEFVGRDDEHSVPLHPNPVGNINQPLESGGHSVRLEGEARDAHEDRKVDVLAMGPTRGGFGELESGISGEPAQLAAIRSILMAAGVVEPQIDYLLNTILHNQIDAALDSPPPFKGQPMPGDEDTLLKQVTDDLSASVRLADNLIGVIYGYGGQIACDEAFRLAQRIRRYSHRVAMKGGLSEARQKAFAAEIPHVARIATDAGYDASPRYRMPEAPELFSDPRV